MIHSPIRVTTAFFILYCVAFHLISGVTILTWPEAQASTAIAGMMNIFPSTQVVATLFLATAMIAVIGMKLPFPLNVVCLLPQQALLLISASAIITSVIVGHFADGVIRPRGFIFADHFNIILMAFFHALVIVMRGALSSREKEGLFYHPFEKWGLH